jgi:hypothetical protein
MYTSKRNLVIELGGRTDTNNVDQGEIALGARYQQSFGSHVVWQVDGSIADYENRDHSSGYSLRTELIYKF